MDHHYQYTQHLHHIHHEPQPQQQQQQQQHTPTQPLPRQPHPQHPHLHAIIPPHFPLRTGSTTPVQSPNHFSPSHSRPNMSFAPTNSQSDPTTPAQGTGSPYLHPLQSHKVRETHSANVERDSAGRKFINQYEVIEEIARGVHGKVKLARIHDTNENVAIKIIPRFSRTRRLGKVTAKSPVDKTKREIAILKKIRHPNVVALLEVIDDPELKKIYMVLEYVELGEVVWRKKGLPHICLFERRRIEREMRGELPTEEEMFYTELLEKRQAIKDMKRAKMAAAQQARDAHTEYWSLEYGTALEEEADVDVLSQSAGSRSMSAGGSRAASRTPPRVHSLRSLSRSATPQPIETIDEGSAIPPPPMTAPTSAHILEGTMYGPYAEDAMMRARSPSMADSIISHMSSIDFNPHVQDAFADDYSYVPCFTMEQARTTFRDTVLGLEYLHYQGIIHRDIKPANLLWTREHRTKISDFGVSYFGRPIRDGEPDDLVSESEAHDFDDELELAKTVGTPAFFAPELCYTDLEGPPPKISEQIDVWSLGVTLYCLIFARIPFLAEDEFQMFRKIATEEVHIPRRRLRPVDPSTSPTTSSLYKRASTGEYRDDNELAYEEIDDLLHDLLTRMLKKNPTQRIRLHEVKRHPWVVEGIPPQDLLQWLDETDPRRAAKGQRIQVDERDMSSAVVPLTLVERARSLVKKTYNKVVHGRSEGSTRRRAASSVASSAGESAQHLPTTPHPRDLRRRSIKPEDYFSGLKEMAPSTDHPLSQSVAVSPMDNTDEAIAIGRPAQPVGVDPKRQSGLEMSTDCNMQAEADRPATASNTSPSKPFQRHSYARSITNALLHLAPSLVDQEQRVSPTSDSFVNDTTAVRKTRDARSFPDDSSRARSVDRGLFYSDDKRSEPRVALSNTVVSGNVQLGRKPRPMRSIDLGKSKKVPPPLASPLFFSPRALSTHQAHPKSDSSIRDWQDACFDGRPLTAHRIENIPEGEIFTTQHDAASAPPACFRRGAESSLPAGSPREDDAVFDGFLPPNRESTCCTIKSSSSNSVGAMTSPMTSPTAMTSPICAPSKGNSESMLVFQSDPSLPALLSGASSLSADAEGDFLTQPGYVDRSSMIETTDSLTPPAIVKETSTGFPIDKDLESEGAASHTELHSLRHSVVSPKLPPLTVLEDEDSGSDSDSDGGFLMMSKGKKKKTTPKEASGPSLRVYAARRRNTNASIGSTETAKKVGVDGD